jgi:hydroxyacylglutathione hydrolase
MGYVRVDRFYLSCLAHASYLVSSERVAAVVDPQRDIDIYLENAARLGVSIQHVIETHLHADFVSGHRELAERTGATVYLGEGAGARFAHVNVKDGEEVKFGRCRLQFLQTPGHTLESICVLMTDLGQPERPGVLFSGDTLFIGDVGRPDLSANHTPQQLAALLYRSLWNKVLQLPDATEVLPAHGAGSLCGRQMSSDSSSTIGKERRFNYALQARSEQEFVHLLTDSLPPRPEYFARDVELNRNGAASLSTLPELPALSPHQVVKLQQQGAVLLDTRAVAQFGAGYVPGSVHVSLVGQYASWAARILGLDAQIILVAEDAARVRESQMRLARVGMENVLGHLAEGVGGWTSAGNSLDTIPQISVQELAATMSDNGPCVLDVREPGERNEGTIANSIAIPLGQLAARIGELDSSRSFAVHCRGGYRSSIATSLLRRAGIHQVSNVTGGFDAWRKAGLPVIKPSDDEPEPLAKAV